MGFFDFIFGKNKKSSTKDKRGKKINLSWPFEVITVPGQDAPETWHRLREDEKGKFHPVIIGSYEDGQSISWGIIENTLTPEEILNSSENISPQDFFTKRIEQDEEYYKSINIGEWPGNSVEPIQLTGHTDIIRGRPLKEVLIAKIPAKYSWEVPAFLKYGGWNECPHTEEHVALLKHWNREYGAEIITATRDIIECTVEKPPVEKNKGMKLAREQFIYCPDIVYQGTGTLSQLAASLLVSKYWYFWWD